MDRQFARYWFSCVLFVSLPVFAAETCLLSREIGQLFIVEAPGHDIRSPEMQEFKSRVIRDHIGGVLLFDWNLKPIDKNKDLTKSSAQGASVANSMIDFVNFLQTEKPAPETGLFISIDQEGGKVQRLNASRGFTRIPSAKRIGDVADPNLAYEMGRALAEELRSVGVNWNFSPVLDIANNPNSSAIVQVKRAFSANPAVVGKMGGEMISGMQDSGVIATAKHFPGHGDAAGDSHLGQVVLTKSWQEITRNELVPFIDAINRGVDTVMVGHITVKSLASLPGLDKDCARLPASLNSFLIQKVLRQDLGHRGLVLTDDLSMGAITSVTRSQGAAAEAAILAGADVMLMRKGAEKSVIPYLCQKSSDDSVAGRRLASRIRESYERVMATKQKYKINSPKSLAHLDEAVSTSAHRNTAETIWNRANDLYAKDPSREDEYTPGVSSSRSASGQLKDNLKDALRGLRELMGK